MTNKKASTMTRETVSVQTLPLIPLSTDLIKEYNCAYNPTAPHPVRSNVIEPLLLLPAHDNGSVCSLVAASSSETFHHINQPLSKD
jgi:hypothetical protein